MLSVWKLTLHVWRSHNEGVHGKRGKYSKQDETALRKSVSEVYECVKRVVSAEDEWLFRVDVKIRAAQAVPQMIGWLERVLMCQ